MAVRFLIAIVFAIKINHYETNILFSNRNKFVIV